VKSCLEQKVKEVKINTDQKLIKNSTLSFVEMKLPSAMPPAIVLLSDLL